MADITLKIKISIIVTEADTGPHPAKGEPTSPLFSKVITNHGMMLGVSSED